MDEVVREAEALNADTVVLSYEGFSSLGEEQIYWFRQAFEDITAVVHLRRQDQFVNSYHNQLHKAHRITLEDIEVFERSMLDYSVHCDYRKMVERWAGILGDKQIVPIIYNKSTASIRDFFNGVGLDVDYGCFTETYPNGAINAFGMSVMRWVKRLSKDDHELPELMNEAHRVLVSHFSSHTSPENQYSLSFGMRTQLMEQYESSNEWVRERYFPDRTTLFPELEIGQMAPMDFSVGRQLAEEIVSAARLRLRNN